MNYRYSYVVICHSGTKGMHWGVRNYQNPDGTWTELGKERRRTGERARSSIVYSKSARENYKKTTEGSYHYLHKFDYQWKEVINASDLEDSKHNVAYYLDKDPDRTTWKFKNGPPAMDKLAANVNKHFGEVGTTNNCKKCTMTMELQRRGYAVEAGRSFNGGNTAATTYWFDGVTQYKERGVDAIADRLSKTFGNNGTGELTFSYPGGGGHSVYAYVDQKGYHIADGQCHENITGSSWKETLSKAADRYGFDKDGGFSSTRLDTGTPNFKHMDQDSVIRVSYTNDIMNQMYSEKEDKYRVMYDYRTNEGFTDEYRNAQYYTWQRLFGENLKSGNYGYRAYKDITNHGAEITRYK